MTALTVTFFTLLASCHFNGLSVHFNGLSVRLTCLSVGPRQYSCQDLTLIFSFVLDERAPGSWLVSSVSTLAGQLLGVCF